MRVTITGASGVFGRGIADMLRSQGHEIVGLARTRPANWPLDAEFMAADIRDSAAVKQAVDGSDVVAHCAWVVNSNPDAALTREINLGGTRNVIDAMQSTGARRIVFASSVLSYGARPPGTSPLSEADALVPSPDHWYGFHKAQVEQDLAASGLEWVAIRPGIVVGRGADNIVLRLFGAPVFPNVGGSADRGVQVVHPDDVHRLFTQAIHGTETGAVNLAADGVPTLREICDLLGRPLVKVNKRLLDATLGPAFERGLIEASPSELDLILQFPVMDTSHLKEVWGYQPAWNARECLEDFALAVRGRVALGTHVLTVPWRIPFETEVSPVDAPAADGADLSDAAPDGLRGEFDNPVDPRFPTFVATNLSEALPGPFTPSSESVTVRGVRAAGASMADKLKLHGVVRQEMATRSIGVFGHRLYAGVSSVYYMADAMPGTDPDSMTSQFFGRSVGTLPIFGAERPPAEPGTWPERIRSTAGLALNGIGLLAASTRETEALVADLDRLESMVPATDDALCNLDEARLESLLLLARDLTVHAWVLACWGGLTCTATATTLQKIVGTEVMPEGGEDIASARVLSSVKQLALAARGNRDIGAALTSDGDRLAMLKLADPAFHDQVLRVLHEVGHRGPGECEMEARTYWDQPDLFLKLVEKFVRAQAQATSTVEGKTPIRKPWRVRTAGKLASRQLRDREVRRDKVVRGIWVTRRLLREQARRLVAAGVLSEPSDIFYLRVDELAAIPPNVAELVQRRRDERYRLAAIEPEAAFSGSWSAVPPGGDLGADAVLPGLGVSAGLALGRVRIVTPDTIDDLEPGEVLVSAVTDAGYTPSFGIAAAVVTDLGGPLSHAAVVAREYGVPCVVDTGTATKTLKDGDLVEVDGKAGTVRLLANPDPTTTFSR